MSSPSNRNKKRRGKSSSSAYSVAQVVKQGKQQRTIYRDENGKFISKEKALKKQVFQFRDGELIKPDPEKHSKKSRGGIGEKLFTGELWSTSARTAVIRGIQEGKRVGIKIGGKILEIGENDIPYFEAFFSDVFKQLKNTAEKFGASPIMRIGYTEGTKGRVLDFDSLDFMSDEFNEELDPDDARDFNLMRGRITQVKNKYYGKGKKRKKGK